ncbi:MAG: DUF1573 domain-containing protein [Planctomycetaceae bacterium]|jgi:hypothetical protein|nr:DUF1573 domain-containing protein [Planctomycetaceae bacterium]
MKFSLNSTLSLIVFSVVTGIVVGIGTTISALTINGWNPELEYKKYTDIMLEAAAKVSNPNAKALVENSVYDFGIKGVQEKGQHNFSIKNVGTAVLTLEVNQTTCTCTGIDLSSKSVKPGETAIAIVRYNAERATAGPYHQGGTIVTNDPENREILLSVKGIFTSPIVVNPGSVFFPSIPVSESRSADIRFYGFEKTPLQLETPEWNNHDHFEFHLEPSTLSEADQADSMRKNAASVYEGRVTIKPGLPVGTFQEKFFFKSNYPSQPTFELSVRGQITGSGVSIYGTGFNKETGSVLLGKTGIGQKIVKDVSIQFTGTAAFRADLKVKEIRPVWLKAILSESRDLGGESVRRCLYSLTIEVPTDAPVCNFIKSDEENVAMITLETGLDDMPILKLPVQFAVEQ